jgi:hypothetical protein
MRTRPRPIEELLQDSAYLYQVGKLTGAASMVGYWLSLRDDEELKKMGAYLNEIVGWFYIEPQK